ncbi:MAG: hypothetical protein K2J67_05670 [Lachnospiraceae bacterium]|nr:hypothetical protein [Lachnospiraceae bacterium]
MKIKKLGAILLAVTMAGSLAACGKSNETRQQTGSAGQSNISSESTQKTETNQSEGTKQSNVLITYFSRFGNTDYPDDIDASTSASVVLDGNERYGTTEYIAGMIKQSVGGDLHLIETKESYSENFDEVREKNHDEMEKNYLPPLKESDLDISKYDMVFIGYPVWATDVPQAVLSFLEEYDLSGKTVIPFCTHDGYGAGSSYETVEKASHSGKCLDGLAVEAEDVLAAQDTVANWLDSIGINAIGIEGKKDSASQGETAIKIRIGDKVLDGVIYDTALAQEIKSKFPLTVTMSGYGGREYYGGIEFTPEKVSRGQLNFENGDITYCETNNSMAIFYAQTDHPDLTMEVIPIGKVTSDLSVFDDFGSTEDITFTLSE